MGDRVSEQQGEQKDGGSLFSAQADQEAPGILREFWDFLRCNKKWWLLPIIVVLVLVAIVAALSSTPIAPFIYPLF